MELITLQKHNKQWKDIFLKEQELIFNALGQTIDKIHHVGSTAVPDLLAKPVIDIAVESISFPPSPTIIDKLATIEYECKGEAGIIGRFWFTKGLPRKFNLHFCMTNSDIVQKQIILRDKLTKNDYLRREYELLKLKNYKDKDIDSSEYAFAKSDFIQKVIATDTT
ncbi:MAG: GrpB family protein [Bacteroidetes bacterium]|nr:GrpB family protein [Bacteroidota bacterium]